MRRSWSTILLFSGLIGLLVLLGVLQYRWQKQISASESEKMQKRLQEQTARFASDFNREIQNAYFNFQTDAENWESRDWSDFNARLDYWRSKTQYPELVSGFDYFDSDDNARPLRYNLETRSFEDAEWDQELRDLRSRIGTEDKFKPVLPDLYTLVLPISNPGERIERILIRTKPGGQQTAPPILPVPTPSGYLAIRLNESTIRTRLLPDLVARHFGDGEFAVAVRDSGGASVFESGRVAEGDAKAGMFDLATENFILFANRDLLSTIGGERRSMVRFNTRVETRTFSQVETHDNEAGEVTVRTQQNDSAAKSSVIATRTRSGETAPWSINAQHRDGSIGAFVASTERRNLGIGFGILALLGASVAGIIVSSARARTFAQRQVDFVSSVSHEFRTPLAVIYSAGENLADGVAKDSTQVTRYGNLIKGEGRKLSAMVEQILEFAGANSGKRKYNFRETDISSTVANAVDECRSLLESEGFTLDTDLAASLPSINADPAALNRAIQNLIANSVKYANGDRWIRVSASNGGRAVKITVEDRGIGISRGDLKHVFEPFYRSKEVVDAQIHGNGLGLSLVKQIAEAHGGRVTAESEPGKGSKFTIEIPTATASKT